jgi:hypothetical protein
MNDKDEPVTTTEELTSADIDREYYTDGGGDA